MVASLVAVADAELHVERVILTDSGHHSVEQIDVDKIGNSDSSWSDAGVLIRISPNDVAVAVAYLRFPHTQAIAAMQAHIAMLTKIQVVLVKREQLRVVICRKRSIWRRARIYRK